MHYDLQISLEYKRQLHAESELTYRLTKLQFSAEVPKIL